MPKTPSPKPGQTILPAAGGPLDRKHRFSLQHKPVTEVPSGALRHTQSHRYDAQGRKQKKTSHAAQIPSIMESENSDDELEKGVVLRVDKNKASVVYENEKKGGNANKTKSKESGTKGSFVFENAGFEGNQSKRNSTATSSRAPSVQSLEIVREQYCCCAKRTKCERTLLTTVIVLVIIIVALIVVIIGLAKQDSVTTFNL